MNANAVHRYDVTLAVNFLVPMNCACVLLIVYQQTFSRPNPSALEPSWKI